MTTITRTFNMAKIVTANGEEVICMKEECGELVQKMLTDSITVTNIEYFPEKYSMPLDLFIQNATKVEK